MRIPRIHTAQALQPDSIVELEAGPSQHLARALRMQEGAELVLFDGTGGQYPAVITSVGKKQVTVQTGAFDDCNLESTLRVSLGIAISRGDRMDWVIQKATELGVSSITPLQTERTEVKLKGDRAAKKIGHWQQIAISACEQCGRNIVPVVSDIAPVAAWLEAQPAQLKVVLHHRADPLPASDDAPASVALLIGPEGGLSTSEIKAAEAADFLSLRLGPRVLRTETAPLAALTALQFKWGDMPF
ncbi:ribosomal RNA small subunit methyltransferase E [Halioglobus japonicus]|uniref:Ribosomal RNA small subunit methyltransferase E n=1 Tax=Halioglobus japonicus TaxID=930805 RepID=A0AAP8MCQ5_9GAMM|nr:16S rRNA (uracil(1498)-N(3))-methyltransferase [Halioglobus japonicus]PLW85355.1 16S rRNA (uracil(1498)-N(3))-methyltransferase [Halioglobus japonicus]GHD22165.1 ribosomal RNA small subunit methyltransferase E [Halioglobus japonicus]